MPTLKKKANTDHKKSNQSDKMLMSSPPPSNVAGSDVSHHHQPEQEQRQQQPLSLERKLELLESRFTSPPSHQQIKTIGNDPNGNRIGNSHHNIQTAAVGGDDQPSYSQGRLSLSSPSASQLSHHSFSFDPPSSQDSSSPNDLSSHGGAGSDSQASNLPSSSIRSRRRKKTSVLEAVSLAAERQMKKVMKSSNPSTSASNLSHHFQTSHSHLSSHNSHSSTSNATLLTSHRSSQSHSYNPPTTQPQQHHQQPQVVEAESPPPKMVTPKANPKTTTSNTITRTGLGMKQDKRKKSFPIKRNQPSLTATPTAAGPEAPTPPPKQSLTNKAVGTPPRSAVKRARIADRVTLSPVRSHHHPHDAISGHSRSNTSTTTASKQGKTSDMSSKKGTTVLVAPRNNTLIRDFFSSAVKNNHKAATSTIQPQQPLPTTTPSTTNATTYKRPRIMSVTSTDLASTPSAVGTTASSSSMTLKYSKLSSKTHQPPPTTPPPVKMDKLQQKVHDLESSLQEKDEQLKAVANNQTILHTALKSALVQKEHELEQLQTKMEYNMTQNQKVMEQLKRSEAQREARELRDTLATDGTRLGRLVYTRAGLSLHSVESWQDGHAPRALKRKRALLEQKKVLMQQRYQQAKNAIATLQKRQQQKQQREEDNDNNKENQHNDANTPTDAEEESMVVGGIAVHDALTAMEAEESVRLHLKNIQREEQDLLEEEHALYMEKGNHIRNLKRVASEDGSRFKSRPKLHGRYVLQSLLGKGGFSEVWRAYDLVELREVAVKIHQLDPRWSDAKKENYTKHVSREYEIHRDVRHPRIVSLYDVFEIDNNSFATVLELCKGTDLDTLLKEKKRLSERDARAILIQILTGMQYLSLPSKDGNRQGIIHYDLKPGNILFDENGDAKITDFGLSKIVDAPDPADSMELTSQGAGTYWYLPPECFVTHQSVRISNKVDVWSIGVIYFQMLFGKRPFGDGQSQDKVLSNHTMLNAREVKFPDKVPISQEGQEFIKQCLAYDQAFRPTVAQLCQSSYLLQKMNF